MTADKLKRNPANLAKSSLLDWSAVAIAIAYTTAQGMVDAIPDLPQWAMGVFVILAILRALAIQFLADRDGDGKPDYRFTPEQLADGLRDGVIDFEAAKAIIEKHAGDGKNDVPPDEPPAA